jgi:FkbM family methyltransferase
MNEERARMLSQLRVLEQYRQAESWRKPMLDPARFLRNQWRKLTWSNTKAGQRFETDTIHLPRFTVVGGEAVSEEIAGYGIYEARLTEAFVNLIKPGALVVDVGMHLGYYTTLFATLAGTSGEVHAFEPTPSTRELAGANVGRFKNIQVHPFAMWSREQKMTFRDYGVKWMAFNSFTDARSGDGPKEAKEIEVDCTTLDAFRRQLSRPIGVMKIDAESAEVEIIKGGRETLLTDRPVVSMEVGDNGGACGSGAVIEAMSALGFRAWEFTGGRFAPHERRASYAYDNLLFAHESIRSLPV